MKLWDICIMLLSFSAFGWLLGEINLLWLHSRPASITSRVLSSIALCVMAWVVVACIYGWTFPDSHYRYTYLGVDFRDFPFERDQ